MQPDAGECVERVLPEVALLEVRVHVEAGGAEVVGARDVRDDALAPPTHAALSHPNVPVP